MKSNLSIEAILKAAIIKLAESGSESPSLDAAVLLCHVLDKPRSYLLTWPEKQLTAEMQKQFDLFLKRRLVGEPIAYITGEREFWSLPLMVSPSTLIPRPDTERLVEVALSKVSNKPCQILDLGTGTGAIALAIAFEYPQHTVTGVDIRVEAKELAEKNAKKLAIDNVEFLQGSWFEPLENKCSDSGTKFALIVSNPPYIEKDDPHLVSGDVRFEPMSALVAEEKGFSDIRIIATKALVHLEDNGWLLFEHGFEQAHDVRELMISLGYTDVSTEQDYAGNDRVTYGRYGSI
ncbi:peptide chain release factor N(5)-glutamine methyltransferase [Vibrio algarum]|uniref:Release factor glutamine methyltransferase n=1 Tax=Vibrio algarum TaxID=3020714 RepID=A0ABT4YNX1_9VIBR|nr:peptide chain release factor N(5)-glutamine methyltransferase [Vibrio sp. KJ40-1]MDB1123241.1 peptide chain release factor N(5)-glutamine methyltransferase [Vibrio sp. KJ40-1]